MEMAIRVAYVVVVAGPPALLMLGGLLVIFRDVYVRKREGRAVKAGG
jgi:hypothetical protein